MSYLKDHDNNLAKVMALSTCGEALLAASTQVGTSASNKTVDPVADMVEYLQ